jgi:recombination protein U
MATWKAHGLRGSTLEEMINQTIDQYRSQGLALIQKIPTPITPINIDKRTRHITLAYFDQRSTVDYMGVVQGIPVCFDAKECASDTFPLQNVHEHQIRFMNDFEKQKGIAFLILSFTSRQEYYYMPCWEINEFWDRMKHGGRKSFLISELDPKYFLNVRKDYLLPILEGLQIDLNERGDTV